MDFVVIRDMSAGNAETGEAWQETKIFNEDTTLKDVMAWAMGIGKKASGEYADFSRRPSMKRVTITKPHS